MSGRMFLIERENRVSESHRDLNGVEIKAGCKVAYFQGGRYDSVNIGEVLEVRTKVKILVVKSSRQALGARGETWVHSDRIVVIEQQAGEAE